MDFEIEHLTGGVVLGLLAVALALTVAGIDAIAGFEVLAAGDRVVGFLAAGDFSAGVLSTGIFSVGLFAAGVFSVGVFSIGIFSIGIFSVGIYAAGIYAVTRRVETEGGLTGR